MTHPSAAPASHSLVGKVHVDNPETVSPATPSPVFRIFDEAFSLSLDEIHWEPPHRVPPETFWSRIGLWFAQSRLAANDAWRAVAVILETLRVAVVAFLGPVELDTVPLCSRCERVCREVFEGAPECSGPRVLAQCCVTLETVELTDEGTCPHVGGHLHPLTGERLKATGERIRKPQPLKT